MSKSHFVAEYCEMCAVADNRFDVCCDQLNMLIPYHLITFFAFLLPLHRIHPVRLQSFQLLTFSSCYTLRCLFLCMIRIMYVIYAVPFSRTIDLWFGFIVSASFFYLVFFVYMLWKRANVMSVFFFFLYMYVLGIIWHHRYKMNCNVLKARDKFMRLRHTYIETNAGQIFAIDSPSIQQKQIILWSLTFTSLVLLNVHHWLLSLALLRLVCVCFFARPVILTPFIFRWFLSTKTGERER